MDAQTSGTVRKERWMKTALVVLTTAVVALATALALVAGQEGAIVIPGGIIETPVAATSVKASSATDAAVSLDEPTAEPTDTATPDIAGGISEGLAAGLSEAEHAALGELLGKFQDPELQLSESERAELVELASGLQAGTIIFPEEEDGELMYRFYTGKEYPLFVNNEGRAGIRCPERPGGGPHLSIDEKRESIRKYYERIHREVYPDFEGDYAEWDYSHMYGRESELASAFHQMYGISGRWFPRNVPFSLSGWGAVEAITGLYDDQGNFMGVGTKIYVCPKVHVSDIAPESSLSMFEGVIPIQLNDRWMNAEYREGYDLKELVEIEEWWESRNGGE